MEKTKKIDVFNKTPRKIKCITNEMDYLGDGTIFREDKLVVGQLYTLIEAAMESYGSVVYLKEIPSNMGIQSCMFEELEEYDLAEFGKKSEKWLQDVLKQSEKEIQNGEYLPAREALAILREHLEQHKWERDEKRNPDRIKSFLSELAKVWEQYPDLRFGQIVAHIENDETKRFYMEDDELLQRIKELQSKND